MLVKNQKLEVKWSKRNREHYESFGYNFTNSGDIFVVAAEHLTQGSHNRVSVQCDYCNKIYTTEWKNYVKIINKNQKCACDNCKVVKKNDVTLFERQTSLYNKLLDKCDDEGYVLLTKSEEILNNITYIKYKCPIHGEHIMRIANFLNGKRCPECALDKASEKYRLTTNEVIRRVNNFGGVILNANEYKNNSMKNLKILCFECGEPFITSLGCFEEHGGQVCPACSGSESIGEKKIRCYLETNRIISVSQKWFSDCRDIKPLPFDFYLPDYNVVIEFDGRQHFEETNYFSYSLEKTQQHDDIKNNYCKANGIHLIRIPYWDIDKIEQILDKELILHEDIV